MEKDNTFCKHVLCSDEKTLFADKYVVKIWRNKKRHWTLKNTDLQSETQWRKFNALGMFQNCVSCKNEEWIMKKDNDEVFKEELKYSVVKLGLGCRFLSQNDKNYKHVSPDKIFPLKKKVKLILLSGLHKYLT